MAWVLGRKTAQLQIAALQSEVADKKADAITEMLNLVDTMTLRISAMQVQLDEYDTSIRQSERQKGILQTELDSLQQEFVTFKAKCIEDKLVLGKRVDKLTDDLAKEIRERQSVCTRLRVCEERWLQYDLAKSSNV